MRTYETCSVWEGVSEGRVTGHSCGIEYPISLVGEQSFG